MHYLILDTCVWVDLAVAEFSLVPKLAQLIQQGKVTIVIPELVLIEWGNCKSKILSQIKKKINEQKVSLNAYVSHLKEGGYECNTDALLAINSSVLSEKISSQRIIEVEKIIKSQKTVVLPISHESKLLAIDFSLQKKAPFRERNSMADALIFFTAVEWANKNPNEEKLFISVNTKDFSDTDAGRRDELSPDLSLLAHHSGLKFFTVLARVLREVESLLVTEEEVRHGDLVVEQIRINDEILEAISANTRGTFLHEKYGFKSAIQDTAAIAPLLHQSVLDALLPMGVAAELLKQREVVGDLVPMGAAEILKHQSALDSLLPTGAAAELLKQREMIGDLVPMGAAEILKHQSALDAVMMHQNTMDKILPKGVAEILELQRMLDRLR